METKITLSNLSTDYVDVVWQDTIEVDGVIRNLDLPRASSYTNSEYGRSQVLLDLPENYQTAIFAVWGETPTIVETSSQE